LPDRQARCEGAPNENREARRPPPRARARRAPGSVSNLPVPVARAAHAAEVQERLDLRWQPEQVDEAFGVLLVVDGVDAEGREVLAIERRWRLAARDNHVALVELQPYSARNVALRRIDEGVERGAQRRVPLAVVDELGVLAGQHVLQVQRRAIE